MIFLSALILFVFGLIIGSFLNVVIYRTLNDESPIEGRSRCDHCRKQIAWYDNIPLLSFLILGGRCRYCKKPIALMHPIVEFTTGILFVWWYLWGFLFFQLTQRPFDFVQPLFWLLVAVLLLIIFFSDLTSYIIPDYAVGSLLGIALLYRIGLTLAGIMRWDDFIWILGGMLLNGVFFFLLWLVTKGKGMGFGDVKFAFPMGLLLGWPQVIVGVFIAFILGSVVGVGLLVSGKKQLKQPIPFGPFLIAGTLIALVYGEQLLHWYLQMI